MVLNLFLNETSWSLLLFDIHIVNNSVNYTYNSNYQFINIKVLFKEYYNIK